MTTKVRLVKAMVFPVVMYGCESWTVKKAECRRIDAFELWCWKRLLRVPWTARRSTQSILKEISPGCSLEGLMLKLNLQYFGHMMWRTDSLEKTLMLGKIKGRQRRGRQRTRWLDGITESTDMSLGNLRDYRWTGRPGVLQSMGSQRVGYDWATKLNWPDELFWQVSIFLLLSSIYSFNPPWWILWLNVTWDSLFSRVSSTVQLCIIKCLFPTLETFGNVQSALA